VQAPGPADEGEKDTSQDKNLLQAPGPADEGDKDTSQDENLLQDSDSADEGDKVTLQAFANPCYFFAAVLLFASEF
jgi:hypothetical protein